MHFLTVELVPSQSDSPRNRGDWHVNLLNENGLRSSEAFGVVPENTISAVNFLMSGRGYEVFKYDGDNRYILHPIP